MSTPKLIDVEKIFESKNAKMLRFIPRFFISYLKRIVHQDDINEFLIRSKEIKGIDFADTIIEKFGAKVKIKGLENVPDQGRYVFASNHPLGGLDGMVFIHGVRQKFDNIKFPVNDILMNLSNFDTVFLPINKHGSSGKDAIRQLDEAFASDAQILMFPAGIVSRKNKGLIKDDQWRKTFVAKAVQHGRDVIPAHISGQNSNFFYNLHNVRKFFGIRLNMEMLYLPDEMYKQQGKEITITFGKPIALGTLKTKPAQQMADEIKEIAYSLVKNN